MTLIAYHDLELHQTEWKIVFLNENLDEDVYIDQLMGCLVEIEGKEHMVCRLNKSTYEHKQASTNSISSPMIVLCPMDLRKTLLIGVYIWRLVGVSLYLWFCCMLVTCYVQHYLGLLSGTKKFLSNNFEMNDIVKQVVIGIKIYFEIDHKDY